MTQPDNNQSNAAASLAKNKRLMGWFRNDSNPPNYLGFVSFIGKMDALTAYKVLAKHLHAVDSLNRLDAAKVGIVHIRQMRA